MNDPSLTRTPSSDFFHCQECQEASMVFSLKEIASFEPHNVDILYKYDLSSCVLVKDLRSDDLSGFWNRDIILGERNYAPIFVHNRDLYRLKYAIDIDIETLKKRFMNNVNLLDDRDMFLVALTNVSDKINRCRREFLRLYRERHLQHRKDAELMIVEFLSLCEKINISDFNRYEIMDFFLQALKAGVTDYTVWEKFFFFVNDKESLMSAVYKLDPPHIRHVLRHIYNTYENNEDLVNKYMIGVFYYGKVDKLKACLEFKSKVVFNLQNLQNCLNDFFWSIPSPDHEFYPKEYSNERLYLLVQMAHIVKIPRCNLLKTSRCHSIDCEDRKACLEVIKLCWKTTPQAFITLEEMRDILNRLYNCIRAEFSPKMRQFIEYLIQFTCEEYEKEFYVPVHEPRTLKNYAMIAVRNIGMPVDDFEKLAYPKSLKDYIKLK